MVSEVAFPRSTFPFRTALPETSILPLISMSVASKLRNNGRTVDLILDNKKLKWAFRHTERIGASRLVMIMPEEWKAGKIRIKDLKTGNEEDVSFIDL